jgi:hypothetical protein
MQLSAKQATDPSEIGSAPVQLKLINHCNGCVFVTLSISYSTPLPAAHPFIDFLNFW